MTSEWSESRNWLDSLTPDGLALLTEEERAELDSLIGMEPLWKPFPGPQTQAYNSQADELFFGGSAGPGKTDLLLGLAVTSHASTLFLRRESVQLTAAVERLKRIVGNAGSWRSSGHGGTMRVGHRVIELAGCEHEDDKNKYQGRPHSLKAFDELSHFSQSQYRFIIGWNRTDDPRERCRVVAAGNPPTTPEGRWVVEEWAPWLEQTYHDPAAPGELRWYTYLDGKLTWFRDSKPFTHKGETITPRSRTFIPARVQDNPVYMATGYLATLQAMPEPLRSQMLYGDFTAGTEDNPAQVIPTAWVRAAQERWTPEGGKDFPLSCVAVDVARGDPSRPGSGDKTVIASRRGPWLARLAKHPGTSTPDGQAVVALIRPAVAELLDVPVHIDIIGVGASVYDLYKEERHATAVGINFAHGATNRRDRSGRLTFRNLRAYAYWYLREALDPNTGDNIALPPDPELLADLTAPRWEMRPGGIQVEPKDDLRKRLGRSPDAADACVMAFLPIANWSPPAYAPASGRAPLASPQSAGRRLMERFKAQQGRTDRPRNPFAR